MTPNIRKWLIVLAALLMSPVASAASYTYDELNRLTSVVFDNGPTQTYSYDAAGNINAITTTGAKADQTLTFGAAPSVSVGGTATVSATSTSGLLVTAFSTLTPAICSVNGSTVSGLAVGTCTIAADQAGDASYNLAPQVTQDIAVVAGVPGVPTISSVVAGNTQATVNFTPPTNTGGSAITGYTVTSSPGGFTATGTASPLTVTGLSNGTSYNFSLTATNGVGSSSAAVTSTPVIPSKADQTISFGTAPTLVVNGSGTVSASASSGFVVTFNSTTSAVCSVSGTNGSIVTGVTAGICTIAASQSGDTNYNAAPTVTQSISVGAGTQSITFGAAPTVIVGGIGTLSATGGASGNPVTFSSTTQAVCTISGSTVTGVTAGICTIAANQAGNANFNTANQVTQSITVGAGTQSISFGAAPTVVVDGSGILSATGGASTNPVTFTSTTLAVCTTSGTNGSTVTGVTAGTCTITANQAGNVNYNAATQVTQNISVGKANQSLNFGAAPTVVAGGTGTVTATGGLSGNPVTFTSTTSGICTVSGSTVTGITTGTCIIAADQVGNANYNAAAQVMQNITVGKGSQTISAFGFSPNTLAVGGATMASANGGASGNPVIFTSTTLSICTVSGNIVTSIAAGSCTIAANQAGNANYNAAPQVAQTITTGKGGQTINFGIAPTVVVDGTGTLSATGGASTSPVIFSSMTTGVCTVSGTNGSTVKGITVGSCTIAANQAGDANYNAAPQVTQTFSIGKGAQTIGAISLTPATLAVGGTSTASATATSGLAVSFNSATPSACSTSGTNGSTITSITAGTCTITADQSGNANYNAATQVAQTLSTLVTGWNLIGNSVDTPLAVASAFGDPGKVTSVWKWTQATSKWSFYAPSLTAPNLAAYAASKGYDVLTTVNGGEGVWVNAKQSFSMQQPAGNAITAAYFQEQANPSLNKLGAGWNLITLSDNVTPSAFNLGLSITPPAAGTIPTNVTTLWVWDSAITKWYFYAPSLEAQGGSALTNYITNKGFLDFTANGKTLGQGMGVWVNRP